MMQQELKRQIGLFDAVMLISGDMIGIGIFVITVLSAQPLFHRMEGNNGSR